MTSTTNHTAEWHDAVATPRARHIPHSLAALAAAILLVAVPMGGAQGANGVLTIDLVGGASFDLPAGWYLAPSPAIDVHDRNTTTGDVRTVVAEHTSAALDADTDNAVDAPATVCAVQVTVADGLDGLAWEDIRAQMPRTLAHGEATTVGGVTAAHAMFVSARNIVDSESVVVLNDGRLYAITLAYPAIQRNGCAAGWENLIDSWTWTD